MIRTPQRFDYKSLASAYLYAKRAVISAGYDAEIAWQEDACDKPITEMRFLAEAAWVVLSAGMRESVVRRVFPEVAEGFAKFATARVAALSAADGGREQALRVFRHPGKIDAIVEIVTFMDRAGLDEILRLLNLEGTTFLQTLPYIGPVTAFHLAKNLGHDVAKPDRHLVRIARACGYDDPHVLCSVLGRYLGEPVPVIDIVLWRFATLSRNYVETLLRQASGATSDPLFDQARVSGPPQWLPGEVQGRT